MSWLKVEEGGKASHAAIWNTFSYRYITPRWLEICSWTCCWAAVRALHGVSVGVPCRLFALMRAGTQAGKNRKPRPCSRHPADTLGWLNTAKEGQNQMCYSGGSCVLMMGEWEKKGRTKKVFQRREEGKRGKETINEKRRKECCRGVSTWRNHPARNGSL